MADKASTVADTLPSIGATSQAQVRAAALALLLLLALPLHTLLLHLGGDLLEAVLLLLLLGFAGLFLLLLGRFLLLIHAAQGCAFVAVGLLAACVGYTLTQFLVRKTIELSRQPRSLQVPPPRWTEYLAVSLVLVVPVVLVTLGLIHSDRKSVV